MATWADLLVPVEAYRNAVGAGGNDDLYRALANRALDIMSVRAGHFDLNWTNDGATGSPTVSGRSVTFPGNLIDVVEVKWNDVHLDEAPSEAWLNQYDPLWRTSDGTPSMFLRSARGLELDRAPTGSTTGLLDIWGLGSIPHFEADLTTNPLTYIPDAHAILPSEYMIAVYPVDLRDRTDGQIAVMRMLRGEAKTRWNEGLNLWIIDMLRRKYPPTKGG